MLSFSKSVILAGLAISSAQATSAESQLSFDSDAAGASSPPSSSSHHHHEHGNGFNPLEHMAGIAPYHDQSRNADLKPPAGCRVSAAAWLIRHSCIAANSDDWAEYMKPLAAKIEAAQPKLQANMDDDSPLAFLKTWKNPISEEMVSQITEPGKDDAFTAGKKIRELYKDLLPRKRNGKSLQKDAPFKVFTASSDRDVETAKAWIKGAFPEHQSGGDGEGDGDVVQLVKVKNSDPRWSDSLTPHKICPAFSKDNGQLESRLWLETYGYPALERLNAMTEDIDFSIVDVAAMFMFCGYESVTRPERKSHFCSTRLFKEEEFAEFGYSQDLKYWYQVGYGAKSSPYLGMGWLNTSTHLLLNANAPPHPHFDAAGGGKLPNPGNPPSDQHTQLFFPYFTHREEPPVALTALGLWNETTPSWSKMRHNRKWKTSHLLPFLGHVALERLQCQNTDYIRVVVNGAQETLDSCKDGPDGTCEINKFDRFVKERVKLFGDFEEGCKV